MTTKITNMTIYDGRGGKLEKATILFDDSGIIGIGEEEAAAAAAQVTVDGTGLCCTPGWINGHAHISLDGKPNMQAQIKAESLEAQVTCSAYRNSLIALQSGIVTIRDMGTNFNASIPLRDAINAGRLVGPRIFTSGRVICMTGGHGHDFGIEADGQDAVRRAARTQLKAGADFIKIMATGGGQSKGMKAGATQLGEQEIAAAVEEAKKTGVSSAAHAQGKEGVMNCLRAGVESIEHGVFLDEEQVELMVKNGTYFCATLLPPYYVVEKGVENGIPPYVVEKCRGQLEAHFESFKLAVRSGVRIIAGNDAGTPFNYHDDMVSEYKMMVKLGMSVRDVIKATTFTAAESLYQSHRIGSLAKGMAADLTIIQGDPEQDIEAFGRVRMVYKEGRLLYSNINGMGQISPAVG